MSKFNITRYDIDLPTRAPMRRNNVASERAPRTLPKAQRPVPTSGNAGAFAESPLRFSTAKAGQYLLSREADFMQLREDGLTRLPYARVERAANGGLTVEGVWCASPLCAAAYVLQRWW